jgi:hypothetical protein
MQIISIWLCVNVWMAVCESIRASFLVDINQPSLQNGKCKEVLRLYSKRNLGYGTLSWS